MILIFFIPCHALCFPSLSADLLNVVSVDEGVLGGGTLLPAQHGDGLPGGETDQLVLSKSILC